MEDILEKASSAMVKVKKTRMEKGTSSSVTNLVLDYLCDEEK